VSDDLLKIAEEMERCLAVLLDSPHPEDAEEQPWLWVAEWAARLHDFWTPERAAFMAGCERFFSDIPCPSDADAIEQLKKLRDAYRAMVETCATTSRNSWT
jgi:hypothetical protein